MIVALTMAFLILAILFGLGVFIYGLITFIRLKKEVREIIKRMKNEK